MPSPAGIGAQYGMALEATPGTLVAPTRFMEFLNESIKLDQKKIYSKGLRAGRRVNTTGRWANGTRSVGGDVRFEVADRNFGLLLRLAMGAVATSGASAPFTHTFSPGDLLDDSFTCQIGRPDIAGVVQPFTYTGCKVNSFSLEAAVDAILQMTVSIVGMNESTAQALATASYPASTQLYTFAQGALTVGGAAVPVSSFRLNGGNNLAERRAFLGSTSVRPPAENGWREFTGDFTAEFNGLTEYNRFVNGTESALILTFTAGTSILRITANVLYDGDTPNVSGPEITDLPVKFSCLASGATDDTAIKIEYIGPDATP